MTVLMVVIQLTGIAYLFVAFPLFVIPWLETLVEPSAPEEAADLEDQKHRLGKALDDKVRGVVDVDLEGELELGEAFHLAEYPIDRDSEFFAVELEDG